MTVGTVHLVGAGPGDPDLLTLKAARLIETADVVLVDSLVSGAIRERIDPGRIVPGRIVDVGKKSGDGERTTQAEINEHLVREARAGREVVRLKGGDPFVFGRGGEEIEYLAAHDVPFEIVPGVTSAIGVPGNAGVPLTHRDHASAVTVVTGHEDPTKGESALDWDALSSTVTAGGTLVILMGVGRLPDNVAALRAEGVPGDTPAGMIERGTCEGEAAVTATLDSIVEQARGEEIEPPAVTVVGDVVAVRDAVLPWLDGSTPTRPTVTAEDGERGVPGHSGD